MRFLLYVVSLAYFAFLVWAVFAPWHSGAVGYAVAAWWFALWFLETRENMGLRKKLFKQQIREIEDFTKFAKEVMKLFAEFAKETEAAMGKERAQFTKVEAGHQRRITDLQGVIKIYARNEEERKAKENGVG